MPGAVATCEPQIRGRAVICSRCGALMSAEQLWHDDHKEIPLLFWRCKTGHITQSLPVPDAFRQHVALAEPRF